MQETQRCEEAGMNDLSCQTIPSAKDLQALLSTWLV